MKKIFFDNRFFSLISLTSLFFIDDTKKFFIPLFSLPYSILLIFFYKKIFFSASIKNRLNYIKQKFLSINFIRRYYIGISFNSIKQFLLSKEKIFYFFIAIFFSILKISAFKSNIPYLNSDSHLLIKLSTILNIKALAAERPILYPLLLKYLRDINTIVILQTLLSIGSWIFCAFSVSRIYKYKSNLIGFMIYTAVLFVGLANQLNQWDMCILKESISISFFLIFSGFNILTLESLLKEKKDYKSIILTLMTFLSGFIFIFIIETNIYAILIFLGFYLLLVSSFIKKRKLYNAILLSSILIMLICGIILKSFISKHGNRWRYPFKTTLRERILPYPEKREYWNKHFNMPLNDRIIDYINDKEAIEKDYELHDLRVLEIRYWMKGKGPEIYIKYMLHNPCIILKEFFRDINGIINGSIDYYPNMVKIDFFKYFIWGNISTLFFIFYIFIYFFVRVKDYINTKSIFLFKHLIILILLLLISGTQIFIAYNADPWEIQRHSLLGLIALRFFLYIIMTVDLFYLIEPTKNN